MLLKNPDGVFSKMVIQTGKTMAKKLAGIAESAYQLSYGREEESNDRIFGAIGETTYL